MRAYAIRMGVAMLACSAGVIGKTDVLYTMLLSVFYGTSHQLDIVERLLQERLSYATSRHLAIQRSFLALDRVRSNCTCGPR